MKMQIFYQELFHVAVTFGYEGGSLVTQNGAFSRQTTDSPSQLTSSSAIEIRRDGCNVEHSIKSNYSGSKTRLEPEYSATSVTTNELSQDQERPVSSSSSFRFLYAAKLHLICLAILVRIMLLINYGFIFGEVGYIYFIVPNYNSHRIVGPCTSYKETLFIYLIYCNFSGS
jgi:hypothetical protein